MGIHLKIFDHLPKTDCRKCGLATCLEFATGVSQSRVCIESCPTITDSAERVIRDILAAEHEMVTRLWGMIRGISKRDVAGALTVLKELFIMFPLRVVWLMLFTAPVLYAVFVMVMLWVFNR